jgi:hypothetical protein
MIFTTVCLATALVAQGAVTPAPARTDASVAPPMPELVVPWVYPRASTSRVIEQAIVPRERDVVRMRTADPADEVEAFYRGRVLADGGAYSVVSAVNQRIVANGTAVVTIESVGPMTVITVVASQPQLDYDPSQPFPVKKSSEHGGLRPPPS